MFFLQAHPDIFRTALKPFSLSSEEEQSFLTLWEKFLRREAQVKTAEISPLDWSVLVDLKAIRASNSSKEEPKWASKLAVVKLNGGLGTSMGCTGPKSSITIKAEQTFLDLILHQVSHQRKTYGAPLPLIFLNSFGTNEESQKILRKYEAEDVWHINQSRYVRLERESFLPVDISLGASAYYPPGHGDVYGSLYRQGVLEELLKKGIEFLFISNADNLAATADPAIVAYLEREKLDFAIEVTKRTKWDVKGGFFGTTPDKKIALLELAQLPINFSERDDLNTLFPAFNTNNLWVRIRKLKELLEAGKLDLPVIANRKTLNHKEVIQLETAMGAGIKNFERAKLLLVDRSRFLPVKTTNDLFLLQSGLFEWQNGFLTPRVLSQTLPYIQLGEAFRNVDEYHQRLPAMPDIGDLESLTVIGSVSFQAGIKLSGRVILIADHGSLTLPKNAHFSNQVVTGSLKIGTL